MTATLFGGSLGRFAFCPKDAAPNPALPIAFEFPNEVAVPVENNPAGVVFVSETPNRVFVCKAFDDGLVGVDVAFSGITNVILAVGVSFDGGI